MMATSSYAIVILFVAMVYITRRINRRNVRTGDDVVPNATVVDRD
jgi:hypothetical protein